MYCTRSRRCQHPGRGDGQISAGGVRPPRRRGRRRIWRGARWCRCSRRIGCGQPWAPFCRASGKTHPAHGTVAGSLDCRPPASPSPRMNRPSPSRVDKALLTFSRHGSRIRPHAPPRGATAGHSRAGIRSGVTVGMCRPPRVLHSDGTVTGPVDAHGVAHRRGAYPAAGPARCNIDERSLRQSSSDSDPSPRRPNTDVSRRRPGRGCPARRPGR
jgi:hypothetical protein